PVLVCGSMAFDAIAVFEGRFGEHILPDRIHTLSVSFLVPSLRREYGGCAGNVAYNLKLLGGAPLPVASVGEDAGGYLQRLTDLGISTAHVKVVPGTLTAQCWITTDLDDNQITAFHPGAMAMSAQNDFGSDTRAVWGVVSPDAKEGMFAHAERLNKLGIPFIFDLGQAMPLFDGADIERMIRLAQVLTANDYEASVIEQRTGRQIADIAKTMQAVIVTRGGEGATLMTGGETIEVPPVKAAAVVDPTGCGDSHRAGLVYGLTQGWNWLDSCRLASVMGAIKIASRGAQNHKPARGEIDGLLHASYGIHLPA
ncbi:MAG TPA: carbohydrate kinase family protein, partial [Bordetella sp.]